MKLTIYHVDAFTNRVFSGNPAAICPLDNWLPDEVMQAIAAENNLSETAFFTIDEEHGQGHIRWFTPAFEINLCGHATLASSYILFTQLGYTRPSVTFASQSGPLVIKREGDFFWMDFPAWIGRSLTAEELDAVSHALGATPTQGYATRDWMVVFNDPAEILALTPDMTATAALDCLGVIATAPGTNDIDFISRFFAPKCGGDPEDPVTGSAHSTLIPYWSTRLGKTDMRARQESKRGGDLLCRYLPSPQGDTSSRVAMAGQAVTFMRGEIEFDV
ncbi:PhzF family phenazine biosynthesis protein [Desulfovibrio inopinatus]|uniref:PhzF family phenazine biosynthesis protein n=1 Tax=Desulfovibrio inopinatus TaxID=102109 RepID=UPI0003FEAC69|nr:PhzF family phenazine biosynthesis protein [Desulfovibrio inopinatus]